MEPIHDPDTIPDDPSRTETTVPVMAEQLEMGVRRVTTGGVRVHKRVIENEETIDQLLNREKVDVRRIERNEVVAGPLPVRQEGDTTIVPVVEEVLVVQKQWVLKEELHITKQRVEERGQQRVVLRREEAQVERLDADGRSTGTMPAAGNGENRAPQSSSSDPLMDAIRSHRPKLIRKNKVIK